MLFSYFSSANYLLILPRKNESDVSKNMISGTGFIHLQNLLSLRHHVWYFYTYPTEQYFWCFYGYKWWSIICIIYFYKTQHNSAWDASSSANYLSSSELYKITNHLSNTDIRNNYDSQSYENPQKKKSVPTLLMIQYPQLQHHHRPHNPEWANSLIGYFGIFHDQSLRSNLQFWNTYETSKGVYIRVNPTRSSGFSWYQVMTNYPGVPFTILYIDTLEKTMCCD